MDAIWYSALTSINLISLTAQTVGHAYFASVVDRELRPYFNEHNMLSDAAHAHLAFGYLVTAAVLVGLSVLGSIYSVICGRRRNDDSSHLLKSFIVVAGAVTLMVLACLTIAYSWGWWHYFAAEGLDHLAAVCRGLAIMLIVFLVMSSLVAAAACIIAIASLLRPINLGREDGDVEGRL
ncbi:hypothetical protein Hte_004481 [Hypoxylon texense]